MQGQTSHARGDPPPSNTEQATLPMNLPADVRTTQSILLDTVKTNGAGLARVIP
jgi:hypothetical protein